MTRTTHHVYSLTAELLVHKFGNGIDTQVSQNVVFVFLMQFGLRRAATFVSSPIHLFGFRGVAKGVRAAPGGTCQWRQTDKYCLKNTHANSDYISSRLPYKEQYISYH